MKQFIDGGDTMETQNIAIEAEFSYERATDITLDLIRDGFSVSAKATGNVWSIVGTRPVATDFKEGTDDYLKKAGVLA